MIQTLVPIARNAFIESVRQPVYLVMLLLAGLLQVINTWVSGFSMGYQNVPGEVTGDDKLLFDVSLATVFVCGMVLAAFIATSSISREIENKTILTVVSKPIGRTTVILGKFLGVAAAMVVAILIMVAMLLMGIRHGVLTTAADFIDQPVIVFGVGGLMLAIALGAITNFLYGWSFPQTASLLMLPLGWIGYAIILVVGKKWELQPITTDLKPQIMLACLCLGAALLVMTSIAVAASTRLGQVMTIVVCLLFFVFGLLSNHFIGRHVYQNERVGQVSIAFPMTQTDIFDFHRDLTLPLAAERAGVTPEEFEARGFRLDTYINERDILAFGPVADSPSWTEVMLMAPGEGYRVNLLGPPRTPIRPGDPFYYGSSPNGVGLVVPRFDPPAREEVLAGGFTERPGLMVTEVSDLSIVVRQTGRTALPLSRPPLPRDSVFTQPTEINPVAMGAWGLVPNMQSFWMVDAITQAQSIPATHVLLVLLYACCQIAVFLSVAVLLFQGRDVG